MIPTATPALLHKLRAFAQRNAATTPPTSPLPSPCISVCRMDDNQKYCLGCLRTLDELRVWGSADEATKHRIWLDVQARSQAQI